MYILQKFIFHFSYPLNKLTLAASSIFSEWYKLYNISCSNFIVFSQPVCIIKLYYCKWYSYGTFFMLCVLYYTYMYFCVQLYMYMYVVCTCIDYYCTLCILLYTCTTCIHVYLSIKCVLWYNNYTAGWFSQLIAIKFFHHNSNSLYWDIVIPTQY